MRRLNKEVYFETLFAFVAFNDRIIGDKIDVGAYEALLEDDVIFENGFE